MIVKCLLVYMMMTILIGIVMFFSEPTAIREDRTFFFECVLFWPAFIAVVLLSNCARCLAELFEGISRRR